MRGGDKPVELGTAPHSLGVRLALLQRPRAQRDVGARRSPASRIANIALYGAGTGSRAAMSAGASGSKGKAHSH